MIAFVVLVIAFGTLISCAPPSQAGEAGQSAAGELGRAIVDGHPWVDLRYRFELVDQDGFDEDANAHTVRTRLGYETGGFYGFHALVEFENIAAIGAEEFNDTVNRKTQFPVVADPDSTEINQASLAYSGIPRTTVAFGRQKFVFDNHRFIGDVGFRQNQQTFDSATLVNESLPGTRLTYAFVFGVRRIFGEDSPVGSFNTANHSVHLAYDGLGLGHLVGYGHFFDIDDDPALSSRTLGIRLTGRQAVSEDVGFVYAGEFAWQTDFEENPENFSLKYFLAEPGFAYRGLTGRFGFELLEGTGTTAFQTPLATLHAFQGWADKFLTTPPDGIQDIYGALHYTLRGTGFLDGTTLIAVYHDFSAEKGDSDFGTELDLKIAKTFFDHLTLMLEFASYDADAFATDTDKFWATVQVKF